LTFQYDEGGKEERASAGQQIQGDERVAVEKTIDELIHT
jgi:hypothetical protein